MHICVYSQLGQIGFSFEFFSGCVCDAVGVEHCDSFVGTCHCHPNVIGKNKNTIDNGSLTYTKISKFQAQNVIGANKIIMDLHQVLVVEPATVLLHQIVHSVLI